MFELTIRIFVMLNYIARVFRISMVSVLSDLRVTRMATT